MADTPFSLATFSTQVADLVDRTSAFVVTVDARHRRPGSGIAIGPELVVTADHVIERDQNITVRIGERRLPATLAGRDPATDVAVLRVPGLGGSEPPRGELPRVGSFVVSIARTRGGDVSAGAGIVSSVGGPLRTGRGLVLPQVIRTDAAMRPGTSGGAIVDASGGVIGMTTSALLRGLPVGIPVAPLMELASALASSTPLKRAYLGVSVQPVRLPKPGPEGIEGGLLIFGVAPDEAADRAGLLVGDVIAGFNEGRLERSDDLQDLLAAEQAGASATLAVIRGGALQRVQVTLGARPSA